MDGEAITTKSDLKHMLLDESMEAKPLSLSLLKCITNEFSNEIGRGGFAVVYKGVLEHWEVAVKQLSQNYIDEKEFSGEVKCLMKAKHKNIVRCLGYCSESHGEMVQYNGQLVMADVRQRLLCFEYVPKGTLNEYIKDASREWGECYKIIKGVCEGLHYLHKERIVHRDLKPANILLDNDMVPKITDFGISRCFDESQTHHFTSKLVGTLGYLAPELVHQGKITFKSDIHSLGIIITEILTGGNKLRPKVEEVQERWSHKLSGSQKEPQLKQIQVCTEVAQTCLEFDPEKRPSAQEIMDTLKKTERVEKQCTEPGASSHGGTPIFVIEAFKHRDSVVLDSKTTDSMLSICKQGINKFYDPDINRIYSSISMEEMYRTAYNLVLHTKGGALYSAVKTTMASQVQSLCRSLGATAAAPLDNALFLQELLARWDRHCFALRLIRDVFLYMDSTYVKINRETPIKKLGLRLWRDEMACYSKIRQSLIEAVNRQKRGEDELVPGVNKMLTELGANVKDMPCLYFQDSRVLHIAGP